MSNPKAQAAKEKGNAAFKAGDYPLAIGHYTSALMADARDPTYPLNRAAAYLKLGKNEDAERDCTTVLGISKDNVKALFRRGQARMAMGRLLEAQSDFNSVLRIEPANSAAKDELKKVATLVQEEKTKKTKSKLPLDATPAPKRRRVPIRIVDPAKPLAEAVASSSASVSNPNPASKEPKITPKSDPKTPKSTENTATPKSDMLEAVSSRSLKKTGAASPPPVPEALASAAASLQPMPDSQKATDKDSHKTRTTAPESFAQAKQSRSSAKPSRVGGGIFRASGESTIFAPRGEIPVAKSGLEEVPVASTELREVVTPSPAAPSPTASSTTPNQQSPPPVPSTVIPTAPLKAPSTMFDFNRAWNTLSTPAEKWVLMRTIPPAQLPALCQTALEPAFLASMLNVFRAILIAHPGDAGVVSSVHAYMDALARIPRFSTLVLFLSRAEKDAARAVFSAVGVDTPSGAWKAVA